MSESCLLDLSFDLLVQILSVLQCKDIANVAQTCRALRRVADSDVLWNLQLRCLEIFGVQKLGDVANATKKKDIFRDLHVLARSLCLMDVAAEGIACSSVDCPEQDIKETLENRDDTFWSSKGSPDPESGEWLIYRLIQPLCIIHEIKILPYKAVYQRGMPIYAPKSVVVSVGVSPTEWKFTSKEFPIQNTDCVYTLNISQTLVFGGYIRLLLRGRYQTQDNDMLYYTCLERVQVLGVPYGGLKGPSIQSLMLHHAFTDSNFLGSMMDNNVHWNDLARKPAVDLCAIPTFSSMTLDEKRYTFQQYATQHWEEQVATEISMATSTEQTLVKFQELLFGTTPNALLAYRILGSHPLDSPLRVSALPLIEKFAAAHQTGSNPFFDYLKFLLRSGKLNKQESIAFANMNAKFGDFSSATLLREAILKGKLEKSVGLGDALLASGHYDLALHCFLHVHSIDKIYESLFKLGDYQGLVRVCVLFGIDPGWVSTIQSMLESNLVGAAALAKLLYESNPPLITDLELLELFGHQEDWAQFFMNPQKRT